MAVIKQRLCRKTEDGNYDTIHLETSSDLIVRPDGSNLETTITEVTQNITNIQQNGAGGNADTATKLKTPRTIRTDLASSAAVNFDGTANITPGVTGVLPVAKGGTGTTSIQELATNVVNNMNAAATNIIVEKVVTSMGNSGVLTLGGYYNWGGYEWQIVDVNSNDFVLALAESLSGTYGGVTYGGTMATSNNLFSGSNLANWCKQFQNTINNNDLAMAIVDPDMTNWSWNEKIFVPAKLAIFDTYDPTKTPVNRCYAYFSTVSVIGNVENLGYRRVCTCKPTYASGNFYQDISGWWTWTWPNGGNIFSPIVVDYSGDENYSNKAAAFRPFVRLRR